jgi:hypothetical protein
MMPALYYTNMLSWIYYSANKFIQTNNLRSFHFVTTCILYKGVSLTILNMYIILNQLKKDKKRQTKITI